MTATSQQTYTLNFDGGSRGNPGPAACGWVIRDSEGELVSKAGEPLGDTTNNVAEYTGLLHGLEEAVRLGVSSLEIRGDSELIVKQVKGEYKVKNAGLKPLFQQVCDLMSQIAEVSISHVYRSDNSEADALVNEALDALYQ